MLANKIHSKVELHGFATSDIAHKQYQNQQAWVAYHHACLSAVL